MRAEQVHEQEPLPAGAGLRDISARVRAVASIVPEYRSEIDSHRRLPPLLVEKMRLSGVFRAAVPTQYGGPELSSIEQLELIETLSRADASVGWCAMIGMDSGIYAGYLDGTVAEELFPRLDMVTAGWVPPMGRAHEEGDNYRVEGRWSFASGSAHADVMIAGCAVYRDGKPVVDKRGVPEWRVVLANPTDFQYIDSWHTTGLVGTGSNDYTGSDIRVPRQHSISFDRPRIDSPLYGRSDVLVRKMSGVPLGVMRSSIDYVYSVLDTKTDKSGALWRKAAEVQRVLAHCEMRLAAARSYVYSSIGAQWRSLEARENMSAETRAHAALARYNAFRTARDVTLELYDLVGASSIYRERTPLDRNLRDMITACEHVVGQRNIQLWAGQLLSGHEPETAFI
jgi:indole-3-acetate monooxygenase